jgi:hypothetical protein
MANGLGSGASPNGVPAKLVQAGHEAYVYALQNGLRLGAGVALAGALVAWTMVGRDARQPDAPAVPTDHAAPAPEPSLVAETLGV